MECRSERRLVGILDLAGVGRWGGTRYGSKKSGVGRWKAKGKGRQEITTCGMGWMKV